jgi:hypothetical protein
LTATRGAAAPIEVSSASATRRPTRAHDPRGGRHASRRRRIRGRFRVYRAKIRYTYSVAGYEFTGRRYALGGELDTSNRARAEARCAKYPEGSEPEVYYDPSNPKDAGLERVQEGKAFTLLIAGVFAAVGAAMLLGFVPGG